MNRIRSRGRRRARTTVAERVAWAQRFERSGLTQREFAERHQLGLSTLRKWIAQRPTGASTDCAAPPLWQELKLPSAPAAARWAAELVRPDGLILRVAHDAPAALVAALWRVPAC